MKKFFMFAVLAIAGVVPGATAQADGRYCFVSGIYILGEPWLAHRQCVPCPTPDGNCPPPGDIIPDLPVQPDGGVVGVRIDF